MRTKYYVTMTDKFMSGWGPARNLINKLIFECDSYEQAQIVADNAAARSDQKYINIVSTKPYYSAKRYLAQYKTAQEYGSWYIPNYFNKAK